MSTSLLVKKMEKSAKEKGIDVEIFALSAGEGKKILKDVDLVLLGPQGRFMKNEFVKLATVPVEVIDMLSYGRMEGEKVLNNALALLAQK
jgi:PTS system cellobiose-specific IIB component